MSARAQSRSARAASRSRSSACASSARRHLVDVEQVLERQHAEHLPQVGVADRAIGAVRLADPVERGGQRARRVEVLGERVEELGRAAARTTRATPRG